MQQRQVAALAARDPRELWAADLDAFLAALDAEEAAEAGRRDELVRQQKQSRGGGGGAAKVWVAGSSLSPLMCKAAWRAGLATDGSLCSA